MNKTLHMLCAENVNASNLITQYIFTRSKQTGGSFTEINVINSTIKISLDLSLKTDRKRSSADLAGYII